MFDPVLRTAEKEKCKADKEKSEEKEADQNDPWNGLQYYIDGETGEHIVQKQNDSVLPSTAQPSASDLQLTETELSIHLNDISQVLETVSEGFLPPREDDGLQPERLRQDSESTHVSEVSYQSDETEVFQGFRQNEITLLPLENATSHVVDDASEQFDSYLHSFIQQQAHSNDNETTPSYIRLTSMEQRWQDVSNLLQLEGQSGELDDAFQLNTTSNSYAAIHESEIRPEDVLLRNVSLVPANLLNYTELRAQLATNASQQGGGDNSDAMDLDANNFFFPNDTSTQSGGFLQKFLKEEHLDDLAIDIPVDAENMSSVISSGSVDRGSDSALSSFGGSYSASPGASANGGGSNISDDGYGAGDFNDGDSMEGATGGESSNIWGYHESRYNLLGDRQIAGAIGPFGVERLQQGVAHNHTYEGRAEKPRDVGRSKIVARDKKVSPSEHRQLSRDHRRAREMNIPFSVDKIINLPIEAFTKLLQEHTELNDAQLTLIRDIRRRGKNKMAAQNCRKRKLGTIVNLEGEVSHLEKIKADLLKENFETSLKVEMAKNKFGSLYKQVFESLRDPSGNPYDPARYSLQQTTSGSIFLVPVNSTTEDTATHNGARRKKRPRE